MLTIITKYLDGIPGELCRGIVKTVPLRMTHYYEGHFAVHCVNLKWNSQAKDTRITALI
jgi:hypothetical protein